MRDHSRDVPIQLFVDGEIPGLDQISDQLGFMVRVDPVMPEVNEPKRVDREHVRSRLLKIRSIVGAPFESFVYLDSDTLVLDDITKIRPQLLARLEDQADLFMLLRRPALPSLWDYGRLNFVDTEMCREGITTLINGTFGLAVRQGDLDGMKCWNAGVILGWSSMARRLGRRWLKLYERMITAPTRDAFVPNDQLCLWLAILEANDLIRVGELPLSWNFMPGHVLQMEPGTRDMDDDALRGVSILHLARNKCDDWARRRIVTTLERFGIAVPWPLPW